MVNWPVSLHTGLFLFCYLNLLMKLSAKSRYAVIAMLDIAIKEQNGPVTLSSIARSQGLSTAYCESLFSKLRKVKLVAGVKGPGGGYRLGKPPMTISIAQIILAVERSYDHSQPTTDYQSSERCMAYKLWQDLSLHLYSFLDEINKQLEIISTNKDYISLKKSVTKTITTIDR